MPELHDGDAFAGHRILGLAGRGGMGIVYRAMQLDLDRPVALKLIAVQLAEDSGFRERFARESRAAASIDHPNVIPIYYTGEQQGALYIAMRYVEGSDLRALVRAEGSVAPARAAHIVAQVASALDAAHARGIVHRDVKPANVLLGADDHVYLTDFGLTKRLASHTASTRDGGWVGTLGYVAPEQIRGERVDARADVYALGCVLYHALAGAPPYQRESEEATLWAHLHDDPPALRNTAPGGAHHDAEEVVQDAFVRALSALRADQRAMALKAWLYTIVRNRSLDVLRRPARTTELELQASVVSDRSADPHERVARAEELRVLVSELRALPERQRTALVMHELGGASHEAIGRHLAVSIGGSKALVSRARSGLARARSAAA